MKSVDRSVRRQYAVVSPSLKGFLIRMRRQVILTLLLPAVAPIHTVTVDVVPAANTVVVSQTVIQAWGC